MRASSSAFEAVIDLAYESVENPDLWEVLLKRLSASLSCSGAIFQSLDLQTGDLRLTSPIGFDEGWLADYEKNWKPADRLVSAATDIVINGRLREDGVRVRVASIMSARFVLGDDAYQSGSHFEEKFRPADLGDYLAVPVRLSDQVATGIGLWAPVRRRRFTDEETKYCERVLPHLSRAARVGDAMRRAKALAAPPVAAGCSAADAIFLVDRARNLLATNGPAQTMLDKGEPVRSASGS